jgi:hypothetical protein
MKSRMIQSSESSSSGSSLPMNSVSGVSHRGLGRSRLGARRTVVSAHLSDRVGAMPLFILRPLRVVYRGLATLAEPLDLGYPAGNRRVTPSWLGHDLVEPGQVATLLAGAVRPPAIVFGLELGADRFECRLLAASRNVAGCSQRCARLKVLQQQRRERPRIDVDQRLPGAPAGLPGSARRRPVRSPGS